MQLWQTFAFSFSFLLYQVSGSLVSLRRSDDFLVGKKFAFIFCGQKVFGMHVIKPGQFVNFLFCSVLFNFIFCVGWKNAQHHYSTRFAAMLPVLLCLK